MGRKGVNKARNFARIMYRLLQAGRTGYPVARLLEECEITRSTYRDYRLNLQDEGFLDFLAADGLEIEEFEDASGHPRLRLRHETEPTYGSSTPGWRERFIGAHLAARTLLALEGTPLHDEVERILGEVESSIKDPELRRTLRDDLSRKLYVHPTGQPDYSGRGAVFEAVLGGLIHQSALEITYDSASHEKPPFHMTVYPYTLALTGDAFYLIARHVDHEDVRTYAMTRIVAASRVLGARFVYPAAYHPERLFDGHFGASMVSETAPRYEVCLRFVPGHALHMYLRERQWHPTQHFAVVDDHLIMQLTVRSLGALRRWVRSFGPDVEVISPQGLRASL